MPVPATCPIGPYSISYVPVQLTQFHEIEAEYPVILDELTKVGIEQGKGSDIFTLSNPISSFNASAVALKRIMVVAELIFPNGILLAVHSAAIP